MKIKETYIIKIDNRYCLLYLTEKNEYFLNKENVYMQGAFWEINKITKLEAEKLINN